MNKDELGLSFDSTITAKEARRELSKPIFTKEPPAVIKEKNIIKLLINRLRRIK